MWFPFFERASYPTVWTDSRQWLIMTKICIGKTLFFSMLHPHNYKAAGGGHAIARSHRSSAPAGRRCRTAWSTYSLASTVDQPSNQSASWTWECKLQEHLVTISCSVPSLWIDARGRDNLKGKSSESLQRTYTLINKTIIYNYGVSEDVGASDVSFPNSHAMVCLATAPG